MKYQEVELEVPEDERNKVVGMEVMTDNCVLIATVDLKVINPIIKLTKAGKRFVDHPLNTWPDHFRAWHLISTNPECKCYDKTYLPHEKYYYTCSECKIIHHAKCPESTYYGIDDPAFIAQSCYSNPGYVRWKTVYCMNCYNYKLTDVIKNKDPCWYIDHTNENDNDSSDEQHKQMTRQISYYLSAMMSAN